MLLKDYRKISKQVEDDLRAVMKKHGFDLKPFGAKIDERLGVVRMTLECRDVNHKGADGQATTPERERYKEFCVLVGMKPEWLDREIKCGRQTLKVVGLKPRGEKCLLLTDVVTQKTYVARPEAYVALLTLEDKKQTTMPSGVPQAAAS